MDVQRQQDWQLPSYDDLFGYMDPPELDNPPTYDEVRSPKARDMTDLPTLVLVDGCHIYAECQSQLPLYSLPPATSAPVATKTSGLSRTGTSARLTQEVTKNIYRLSAYDGEGSVQIQVARLYDVVFNRSGAPSSYFHGSSSSSGRSAMHLLSGGVDIVGDVRAPGSGVAKLVFRTDHGQHGHPSQTPHLLLVGCDVVIFRKDHPVEKVLLQATPRQQHQIDHTDYELEWRDGAGRLLAVETMPPRAKPGEPTSPGDGCADGWRGLPRLEVKAAMATRQFDFLVTCWLARFRRIESVYQPH